MHNLEFHNTTSGNVNFTDFHRILDSGIISPEEFETVQAIQMKGKREEIKKLFRDNGLEDKFKFTYCKSDDRYKLRIPTALKSKYDLKAEYKQKTEKDVIDAVYSDYHHLSMMRQTLDQVYEMWKPERIKKIQQRDRSMHTARKNFEVYDALVKGTAFGSKTFVKIRYHDFEEFYSICEGKHISKSRANEIKTTLNKIWEYAKSKGCPEWHVNARNADGVRLEGPGDCGEVYSDRSSYERASGNACKCTELAGFGHQKKSGPLLDHFFRA